VFSFREWSRKRYAEDPEYRQRRLAYARAYREAHKDEINERRRRKWQTDPAYRQRRLTSLHAYRDARKDEIKERQRRRYKTEPGYREKLVARAKQYQHTRDPQHRPPYDPEYQRKRRLKFVYGISLEEYDAMLARQDGVCAICRNKPDKDKPLCVDHCHWRQRVVARGGGWQRVGIGGQSRATNGATTRPLPRLLAWRPAGAGARAPPYPLPVRDA
jgi:recombination endonuclease VII